MKNTLRPAFYLGTLLLASAVLVALAGAQAAPYERTYSSATVDVERVVRNLRPSSSGRLPTVDGFVQSTDLPIDQYERGYYECTFQVVATPTGGATVRASAKITAWYNDPTPGRAGYRVLVSNGHIENDFLDQIQEALGPASVPKSPDSPAVAPAPKSSTASAPPVSNGGVRPQTRLDPTASDLGESSSNKSGVAGNFSSVPRQPPEPAAPVVPSGESLETLKLQRAAVEKRAQELSADIKNFEEILHNQVRPADLATVKKAGTHVLSKPAEGSPVLFSAAAKDEFQELELEGAWVHLQISGSSRGWIRRAQLDMPAEFKETSADTADPASGAGVAALFNVSKDETTAFGGKWAPLASKKVRVIWLEPASPVATSTAREKLTYARALFEKTYRELNSPAQAVDGVVIVFDSADGGQIAATLSSLKQLTDGAISESAFWKQCSLDPPESFQASAKP